MRRVILVLVCACTPADKHANRGDVRDFMKAASANGLRVQLDGEKIDAWDCKGGPGDYPPVPLDMTLVCNDGYVVRWERKGLSSDK